MDRHDWDARYAGDELLWHADPNRFVVAELSGLAPGRALDLACGEGRNAVWLAERGWSVTAVDFSAVALAKGRRMAADRGVEVQWLNADVVEWIPPERRFDLVVVLYLQLPAVQRHAVYRGAAGAVAAGGTVLVVGHDLLNLTEGTGGPKDPAVLFTPDDVAGDVDGLTVTKAERVHRPVDGDVDAIDSLVRATRT